MLENWSSAQNSIRSTINSLMKVLFCNGRDQSPDVFCCQQESQSKASQASLLPFHSFWWKGQETWTDFLGYPYAFIEIFHKQLQANCRECTKEWATKDHYQCSWDQLCSKGQWFNFWLNHFHYPALPWSHIWLLKL